MDVQDGGRFVTVKVSAVLINYLSTNLLHDASTLHEQANDHCIPPIDDKPARTVIGKSGRAISKEPTRPGRGPTAGNYGEVPIASERTILPGILYF